MLHRGGFLRMKGLRWWWWWGGGDGGNAAQENNNYALMNKILRGKLALKLAVLRHRFAKSLRSVRRTRARSWEGLVRGGRPFSSV
jgi:hypothetical protein